MNAVSGQIVGDKYRIVSVLGEGGVGITYEAESLATGERVALKRVEVRGQSSWKSIELFEREARILSHLAHPSIPAYRDSFVVEERDGAVFWLAQTLARGRSLAAWIESGARCDENEAKRIARALLPVLAYLHQLRPAVIHRDLKPANVIRGDDGSVFLVDFGAVREALQDGGTGGGSTVAGTYGYMAPEQYRGSARPQTDLYGLGATLLYLLARKTPAELPQKKLRVEIPRELGLSRTFASWLGGLLEPAPEDRFASANEALAAIDGPKTSPKRVALLGAILAVAVVGGVGVKKWMDRALPAPAAAAAPFDAYPARLALSQYEELVSSRHIAAHSGIIFAIAQSPDGKYFATASRDAAVKVWDAAELTLVRSHGHVGLASGVGFSPDGKTLVSSGDQTLRFWDVATGNALRSVDLGSGQATKVDVTSNAIAVGSFDGNVRLFDLDGKPLRTLAHSPGKGRAFAAKFSPDGKLVATVGDNAEVKLWDAATGAPTFTFTGHTAAVGDVVFSSDGTMLATASDDRTVRVWNISARRELTSLHHDDEVWATAFSPDGKYLMTGGKDAQLRIYHIPTFTIAHTVRGNKAANDIFFPRAGSVVVAHEGELDVYKMPGGSLAIPKPKGPPPAAPLEPKEAALVYEAHLALDEGEGARSAIARAEKLCNDALAANPKYAPAYIQLSRVARRRPSTDPQYVDQPAKEAHAFLDKAEAIDPKSYDLHVQRAWAFEHVGDREGIRKALDRAEAIDPKRVDGDVLRAKLANNEKQWDDAIKHATRAVEGTTEVFVHYLAWQELEHAYRGIGEFGAADAVYRAQIAESPKSVTARGNYAWFLVRRGEYPRALEVAKEASVRGTWGHLEKTIAEAHVGVGIGLLWDQKQVPEARAHFERATEKDPSNAGGWYGVAACDRIEAVKYRDKQKLARSKEALHKALKADPKHWWAQRALEEHDKIAAKL